MPAERAEQSHLRPLKRTQKLFYGMNRKQNYNYQQTGTTDVSNTLSSVDNGTNNLTVHPRARIYLALRALAPVPQALATPQVATDPSFDIQIRLKSEQLSG